MYTLAEKVIINIWSIESLSYKKKEALVSAYKDLSRLTSLIDKDKYELVSILDGDGYDALKDKLHDIDREIKFLDKARITAVTILSDKYPDNLRNIDCPPLVMYCKGNIDLLKAESIAIVGSRRVSNYGKVVTENFATELSKAGLCIISGLASGVDTIAHTITLKNGGKTIAVLAGGFNDIYPSTNYQLSDKIVSNNGLLVTEYSYYERSEPYHFPLRNRIIAGLSRGVLITEAGEKSGSMHTKNYAIDYNKELFLVPGNITSSLSAGCNNAIKSLQGACVTDPQDILDTLGIKKEEVKSTDIQLSMEESLIVDVLRTGEKAFQEILLLTRLDTKRLVTLLTTLQIRGLIKKLAGDSYVLSHAI